MPPRVEHRPPLTGPNLTNDVAIHLKTRCALGVTVIIVDKPIAFLSTLRKHWIRYERLLQRDRASTIDPHKIVAITTQLAAMYATTFSAASIWHKATVHVVSPDFAPFGQPVKTVYICARLPTEQRLSIRHSLDDDALVIDYA